MFSVFVIETPEISEQVEVVQTQEDDGIMLVFESYHDIEVKVINGKMHVVYTAESGAVANGFAHSFPLQRI